MLRTSRRASRWLREPMRMADRKIQAKVIRTFRNKYSKSLHEAGTYLSITPNRYEEINSAGYGPLVELVEPSEPVDPIEPAGDDVEETEDETGGE